MPRNPHQVNPRPRMLTLPEAADFAGCHPRTLRRRIADGLLPAYRLAGSRMLRVRESDLETLFTRIPTAS